MNLDIASLKVVGKGGEGTVLGIDAQTVLKLYLKRVDAEKKEKLNYFISIKNKALLKYVAMPFQIYSRKSHFGYLMPRIPASYKNLHELYGITSFKAAFPNETYRLRVAAALNIAKVMTLLHAENIIIGDVNHSCVLVDRRGNVRFIDADSYQVSQNGKIYKCNVGVDEYTPPELQGKNFSHVIRTKEHDAFGLAVVIFKLLFLGRHPFSGKSNTADKNYSYSEAIEKHLYAYSRHQNLLVQPKGSLSPADFPELNALFKAAFLRDENRPAAENWVAALSKFYSSLKKCEDNNKHYYSDKLKTCPLCELPGAKKSANQRVKKSADREVKKSAKQNNNPSSLSVLAIVKFIWRNIFVIFWICVGSVWWVSSIIGNNKHHRYTRQLTPTYRGVEQRGSSVYYQGEKRKPSVVTPSPQASDMFQLPVQGTASSVGTSHSEASDNVKESYFGKNYVCRINRYVDTQTRKSYYSQGNELLHINIIYDKNFVPYKINTETVQEVQSSGKTTFLFKTDARTWVISFNPANAFKINYISYVSGNTKSVFKCL